MIRKLFFDKKTLYFFWIFFFSFLATSFAYFIAVNTLLEDKVLPNIRIEGQSAALMEIEELNALQKSILNSKLPDQVEFSYLDKTVSIEKTNLVSNVDSDFFIEYGKGNNFLEVIQRGINLIAPQDFPLQFEPNQKIINSNFTNQEVLGITSEEKNNLNNYCEQNRYSFVIDKKKLKDNLIAIIQNSENPTIDIGKIASEAEGQNLCIVYFKQKELIQNAFLEYNIQIEPEQLFKAEEANSTLTWTIQEEKELSGILGTYKTKTDIIAKEAKYSLEKDKIYLFEDAQEGRILKIKPTIENIKTWIKTPEDKMAFVFETDKPEELPTDYEIYDFTKVMGVGKTRIDLIRDGRINYKAKNAQRGVEEMHMRIIKPKEEFSYIDKIDPQPSGRMQSGRMIGNGICNATTTLFRAVVDAGFPVLERQSHTYIVDSYDWGPYPMSIVDATFWLNPDVDLVFKNDLNYPALFYVEISQDDNDFQYHTIKILSDRDAPDREVELSNWKKWNIKSDRRFYASFDRTVFDNDDLTREDTFTSYYVNE